MLFLGFSAGLPGKFAPLGAGTEAASADTDEEYAFLLLAKSGVRHLTAANLPHLRQLAQKVSHLADCACVTVK